MANKMLIDATHPEETRVVVLKGQRVEEFDLEAQGRRQLRGNIYLAKVTRVEPSLQAAFVDYGGNRHGFLAFSEIHPDYYQIPVADREALLAEAAEAHAAAAERDHDPEPEETDVPGRAGIEESSPGDVGPVATSDAAAPATYATDAGGAQTPSPGEAGGDEAVSIPDAVAGDATPQDGPEADAVPADAAPSASIGEDVETDSDPADNGNGEGEREDVEQVGAEDALEELPVRQAASRRRQYKIQEVIRRRQILLVQVVKEERGTKGAALTTYLSLAGRYCVLMPNTARGGGISRKITSATDRRRLKSIATDLEVPDGTGVIVRTAGANRTKAEIKRDFEYLLRLWESIRELTLKSTAPSLIYEEGNLVKRSIRDLYNKDIDEILIEGDEGYREAKAFMRMLMPSHAKNVKQYKDAQPLFMRHRVESQLDQMFSPVVTLKSGGYLVINQTEALVAIDVNSGKSTREHNIEDTAYQTNLEAAAEVARQLRLRDLAGLIVIDFIDMEEKRNNRAVERKLKECLKTDRARIQVGRISHFGLLEMSRQRIRASVLEGTMEACPHCQGAGRIRSVGSTALQIVRALEEHAISGAGRNLTIRTTTEIALYMLNQKRAHLTEIENRFGIEIGVSVDASLLGASYVIERGAVSERRAVASEAAVQFDSVYEGAAPAEEEEEEPAVEEAEADQTDGGAKRRRRRRRGRRGADEAQPREEAGIEAAEAEAAVPEEAGAAEEEEAAAEPKGRRRRGRRGGRRQRRDADGEPAETADETAAAGAETTGGEQPDTTEPAPVTAEAAGVRDSAAPYAPVAWPWQPPEGIPIDSATEPQPAATPEVGEEAGPAEAATEAPAETAEEPALQPLEAEGASTRPAANGAEDETGTVAPARGESAEASRAPGEESGPPRRGWWQRRLTGRE